VRLHWQSLSGCQLFFLCFYSTSSAGGGCLVKHFGDYPKERVTIIGDLCATAKGYESLCFAQLQRKGQV